MSAGEFDGQGCRLLASRTLSDQKSTLDFRVADQLVSRILSKGGEIIAPGKESPPAIAAGTSVSPASVQAVSIVVPVYKGSGLSSPPRRDRALVQPLETPRGGAFGSTR